MVWTFALVFGIFISTLLVFSLSPIEISFLSVNIVLLSILKAGLILTITKILFHIKDMDKGMVDEEGEIQEIDKNSSLPYFLAWFLIFIQLIYISTSFAY